MNTTITARRKIYRDNINRTGWHVFVISPLLPVDQHYRGYKDGALHAIIDQYAAYGNYRLTDITGNVITFEL